MAICLLNKSLTRSTQCSYSLPKIVDLFLMNYSEVTSAALNQDGNEVDDFTFASETAKVYKVEPAINSASFSDTLAVGASGNKYRIHTVGFSYSSAYNSGMVDTVDALSLGRYIAVCKMADGSYLCLGRTTGLEADADGVNNTGSGDASAEAGLVVSLTANVLEAAMPLSSTAVTTMLAKVAQ